MTEGETRMCVASTVWEMRNSSRHFRIVLPGWSDKAISPAIFSRSGNSMERARSCGLYKRVEDAIGGCIWSWSIAGAMGGIGNESSSLSICWRNGHPGTEMHPDPRNPRKRFTGGAKRGCLLDETEVARNTYREHTPTTRRAGSVG